MRWVFPLLLCACNAPPGSSRFQLDGSGLVNCALDHRSGTAICWGGRDVDVLSDTPRPIGDDLQKIAVNFGYGDDDGELCGLQEDGGVRCWSTTDGTAVNSPDLDGPAVDIAAGEAGTCVVLEAGDVHCWGIWDGEQVRVPGDLARVSSISVGVNSACALQEDGAVECFGTEENLDNNPARLDGFEDAVSVSSGIVEACVLDAVGAVDCWMADGSVERLPLPGSATRFETIYTHGCAVNKHGAVNCVSASASSGSSGTSSRQSMDVPRLSFQAEEVSGGWIHTCAAGSEGVWCWNMNGGDAVQVFE